MKSLVHKLLHACVLSALLSGIQGHAQPADRFGKRCAPDREFIVSLYRSILNREPDRGMDNWVNSLKQGTTREQIYKAFFESPEYMGHGQDQRTYITDLYQSIVGRDPEVPEVNFWAIFLTQGGTRDEVMTAVFASSEYRQLVANCDRIAHPEIKVFGKRCAEDREFIDSLYRSILNREPDRDGMKHWMEALRRGATREEIYAGFFESTEYAGMAKNNQGYVIDLYEAILGHDPEKSALNYWIISLNQGLSRKEVMNRIFQSAEYKNLVAGCDVFVKRCAMDVEFVPALFRCLLKREPKHDELDHWINSLRRGMSREQAYAEFFDALEYKNKGTNNRAFITDLYLAIMGREPEDLGLNRWMGELNHGKSRHDVVDAFLRSPEYRKLVADCDY
jgi:hypothetical protein